MAHELKARKAFLAINTVVHAQANRVFRVFTQRHVAFHFAFRELSTHDSEVELAEQNAVQIFLEACGRFAIPCKQDKSTRIAVQAVHRRCRFGIEFTADDCGKRVVENAARMVYRDTCRLCD